MEFRKNKFLGHVAVYSTVHRRRSLLLFRRKFSLPRCEFDYKHSLAGQNNFKIFSTTVLWRRQDESQNHLQVELVYIHVPFNETHPSLWACLAGLTFRLP